MKYSNEELIRRAHLQPNNLENLQEIARRFERLYDGVLDLKEHVQAHIEEQHV